MVRYLLDAGADIKGRQNSQYRRAIGLALEYGHRALAESIKSYKEENYGTQDCEPRKEILKAADVVNWNKEKYWTEHWKLDIPWVTPLWDTTHEVNYVDGSKERDENRSCS